MASVVGGRHSVAGELKDNAHRLLTSPAGIPRPCAEARNTHTHTHTNRCLVALIEGLRANNRLYRYRM